MPQLEEKYIPSFDGLLLLYRKFGPTDPEAQKNVHANLCLVHGFGEHSARFNHVSESFVEQNFIVHTVDLRGHGYSGGPRADGLFSELIKDIGVLIQQADPMKPLYLFGHSMGGLAVLRYIQTHPLSRIEGAIIASPFLKLTKALPWWKALMLKQAAGVLGEFLISSNIDPCGLSDDHAEVTKVFHDRLMLPFMTVKFGNQLLTTAKEVFDNPQMMDVPCFFVHGTSDAITSHIATQEYVQQVSTHDVRSHWVEGGAHELHNDTGSMHTIRLCVEWLVERTDPKEMQARRSFHKRTQYSRSPMGGRNNGMLITGGSWNKRLSTQSNSSSGARGLWENENIMMNGAFAEKNIQKYNVNPNFMIMCRVIALALLFTPCALLMVPVHLFYVLAAYLVFEIQLTQKDLQGLLLFGMVYIFEMYNRIPKEMYAATPPPGSQPNGKFFREESEGFQNNRDALEFNEDLEE
ncbi:hypothetical protein SARC_03946 [Sphaeroforma arctica JP610]|uniref:Serine aminopeptidase S33 domain-containing protein n=1 Tax=Sphaeroforma arctica JP610 TaxID=667725 RepID=A0A0L0G3Y3_9EUKA|nr:hypothetical protein SARC_03946 [Sphaeroforma arctica JP610]KNC83817.1 hypothetical protein SARC_03946 [Sphaeroforma arctica JP610]|eukprot:XP_014157719.1 hypothetical protein SARC_03946 [Sphaeroforma arctica JP610]